VRRAFHVLQKVQQVAESLLLNLLARRDSRAHGGPIALAAALAGKDPLARSLGVLRTT